MRNKYLQHLSTFADVRRDFGNNWTECCFGKQQSVTLRELSSDTAVLVHLSTKKWLFSSMPVKNCRIISKPSGRRERARGAVWKRIIMGRHRPRGSCGTVRYRTSFMCSMWKQRTCRQQCPSGHGASAVAWQLHWRLSMIGIATAIKNGSVKPSGSSEGIRSNVHMRGIC